MTWIWHMCFTNMKQRGIRTFLTILGVVIGVISIVSMLAIGMGVQKVMVAEVESMGSITEITVYGMTEGKRKDKMLTERTMEQMADLEHVTMVYPTLTPAEGMEYEKYTGWSQLIGVPQSYLEKLEVADGELPQEGTAKPELFVGGYALEIFYNEETGTTYGEVNGEDEEKMNLTGQNITVQFNLGGEETAKQRLKVAGMAKKASYEVYCNIEVLKKYLKRIAKNGVIPGQPTKENGESYDEWIYDSVIVEVDSMEHVDKVMEQLQDRGFKTDNYKEALDSMQKQLKMIQILLGGIGMIALIVAVIGIGNTMTTAVYDRISEIGILKVLGCDPDELLFMFLLESGILGGIGGLVGILASYGVSELLVNKLVVRLLEMEKGTQLSVIPVWLSVSAFFFAVILGLIAGYFPAKWAAKLKPIKAVTAK